MDEGRRGKGTISLEKLRDQPKIKSLPWLEKYDPYNPKELGNK
jgi:hypothetical protein